MCVIVIAQSTIPADIESQQRMYVMSRSDVVSVENATVFAKHGHPAMLVGGDLLGCAARRERHLSPAPEGAVDAATNADLVAGAQQQTRQDDNRRFHFVTFVASDPFTDKH